jgi:hypothetical protein
MARVQFAKYATPLCIAKFAYLDVPDAGYNAKPGDKQYYKIRGIIEDTPENRAWVANVLAVAKTEAAAASVKLKKTFNSPFKMPEDQDEDDFIPAEGKDKPKFDEDHAGAIFFETKSLYQPALLDSLGDSLPAGVKIMSGDKVYIEIQANPYDTLSTGVSLRVLGVQLFQKATGFGGDGGKAGSTLGAKTGGYVAPVAANDNEDPGAGMDNGGSEDF